MSWQLPTMKTKNPNNKIEIQIRILPAPTKCWLTTESCVHYYDNRITNSNYQSIQHLFNTVAFPTMQQCIDDDDGSAAESSGVKEKERNNNITTKVKLILVWETQERNGKLLFSFE